MHDQKSSLVIPIPCFPPAVGGAMENKGLERQIVPQKIDPG